MSVSGGCTSHFGLTDTQAVGLASLPYAPGLAHRVTFSDGTGARKANRVASVPVTLGGSPTGLDLSGGLSDLNGSPIAFTKIKALLLYAPATNAGDVTVGADAASPWSALLGSAGTLTIRPGTSIHLITEHASGYAVTAGTGDVLQVAGTSGDVLRVAIGGEV